MYVCMCVCTSHQQTMHSYACRHFFSFRFSISLLSFFVCAHTYVLYVCMYVCTYVRVLCFNSAPIFRPLFSSLRQYSLVCSARPLIAGRKIRSHVSNVAQLPALNNTLNAEKHLHTTCLHTHTHAFIHICKHSYIYVCIHTYKYTDI